LNADRKSIPALINQPLREPLKAIATSKDKAGGRIAIHSLPIRFSLPRQEGDLSDVIQTDARGIAPYTIASVSARDQGKAIRAKVDVSLLCPQEGTQSIFEAVVQRLTIPETTMVLKIFNDREKYLWHWEFEGKHVNVFCAYEANGKKAAWPKMHDEVVTFLQGKGADVKVKRGVDITNVVQWSSTPDSRWDVDQTDSVDFIVVMVTSGKLNKRANPKNPFGEDVQFVGEIRSAIHKDGNPYFSDRYRGAGGWNPMGEQMCMDVLALHVMKNWKTKYIHHLGLTGQ
jgi:hypothetical protein